MKTALKTTCVAVSLLMLLGFVAAYQLDLAKDHAYYNDNDDERVWQQDLSDGTWYVAHYGQPDISNMEVTEEQWETLRSEVDTDWWVATGTLLLSSAVLIVLVGIVIVLIGAAYLFIKKRK